MLTVQSYTHVMEKYREKNNPYSQLVRCVFVYALYVKYLDFFLIFYLDVCALFSPFSSCIFDRFEWISFSFKLHSEMESWKDKQDIPKKIHTHKHSYMWYKSRKMTKKIICRINSNFRSVAMEILRRILWKQYEK